MKTILAALSLMLLVVSSAAAQPTADQMKAQKSGALKIWTGTALLVGGAMVIPWTVATTGGEGANDAATGAGLGAVGVGSWLVWSGFQQQRRAVGPRTDVGVAVGPRTGVMIRRRW